MPSTEKTFSKVWCTNKPYRFFNYRSPDLGVVEIQEYSFSFQGKTQQLNISNILQVKMLRFSGDIAKNWIQVIYIENDREENIYLSNAKKVGFGNVFGGSKSLFNSLNQLLYNINNAIDFIILTPLKLEYEAVRTHLLDCQEKEIKKVNRNYTLGTFQSKKIVLLESGDGIDKTIACITDVMTNFSPKCLFIVGIAGGIKDVKIGDVVVGTLAYPYERGKEKDGESVSRPHAIPYSQTYIDQARMIDRSTKWIERTSAVYSDVQYEEYHRKEVKVEFGPIASGNKVLTSISGSTYQYIKRHYNDSLAVDMEGAGLGVLARYEKNIRIHAMNIRGISDLIEDKTATDKKGYQYLAAANASAFTFELISHILTKES